ncbi:MAG: GDP-L-fucose synthase [Bradyrhizobium sp.]|nr:GDP-L-fucose synthase [Bradyrhizobium sp.]
MATTPFELRGKTVFVAGHRGMVGGALVRRLAQENVELLTLRCGEVDLRDQVKAISPRRAEPICSSSPPLPISAAS